jgi:hypothetical protein
MTNPTVVRDLQGKVVLFRGLARRRCSSPRRATVTAPSHQMPADLLDLAV